MAATPQDTARQLRTVASDLRANANELTAMADQFDPPALGTPPASPAVPSPQGGSGNYKLLWSDDFTAPALDLSHWRLGRPADAAGGHVGYAVDQGEKTFYLAEQVSIRNGKLVLTAVNKPLNVVKDASKQGQLVGDIYFSPQDQGTWQYRSGTVTTGPDRNGWLSAKASGGKVWTPLPAGFSLTYGFYEVRAKLPAASPGLWPAIWLLPVDGSWSFEIDAMECVDPTGKRIAQHLHANNGAVDFTAHDGFGVDMGKDMTADFHTWAIDWQPGSLRWLIDGQVTQETTKNVPNVPMFLILNVAVGGKWGGDPNASTRWPAEMLVDYLRVFQKA